VALKLLLPPVESDAGTSDAYCRAAERARALNHPNIVRVLEVGASDGFRFVATEHVNGRSLFELRRMLFVRRERLPLWFGLRVIAAACDALGYAHEKRSAADAPEGFLHESLVPEQLMISFRGTTKVLGFGTARVSTGRAGAAARLTSLAFRAPEQLGAAPASGVTARADTYSLGVILYDLLTGERPFRGRTEAELVAQIAAGAPEPPSRVAAWVSPELDPIVLRAIARHPADRYPDALRLRCDLLEALTSLGDEHGSQDMAEHLFHVFGRPADDGGLRPEGDEPIAAVAAGAVAGAAPADEATRPIHRPPEPALQADVDAAFRGVFDELQDPGAAAPEAAAAAPGGTAAAPGSNGNGKPPRRLVGSRWDEIVERARREAAAAEAGPAADARDDAAPVPAEPAAESARNPGHAWDAAVRRVLQSERTGPFTPDPNRGRSALSAEALFDEGLQRMRSRDLPGALAAWTAAVELVPDNRKYHGNLRMLRRLMEDRGQ
jgi:hypothetical protein